MAKAAAIKFNLSQEKWGITSRVFVLMNAITGAWRNLTLSARSLAERISSIARPDSGKTCRLTYRQIEEEFGYAHSTVGAAFAQLNGAELIKKGERDQDGTEYTYAGELEGKKFFIIPQYLYTAEVCASGSYRKMNGCEIRVLSYLMTECSRKENGGGKMGGGVCWCSYRKLARIIGICEKSVRKAIDILLKAKIIFRPEHQKGRNGYKLSGYEVNASLYVYKRYVKKSARTQQEENAARHQYYEELRRQEEARVERYRAKAWKDSSFVANYKKVSSATIAHAKASVRNPSEVPYWEAELKRLKKQRRFILQRLGFEEEDLEVQYLCARCKDTGQLPDGKPCTCYPGGEL